jgi:dolichyl-phosphate beta-glucosyltransferase
MSEPPLSIVIPAYNEAERIRSTLENVLGYVHSRNFPIEVIVVNDGSTDDTVKIVAQYAEIRLLQNDRNRGKGYTVRHGVLEAKGKYVLFSDADLSSPIEETDRLLEAIESSGADAAVGSRALKRELIGVHQPLFRELGGRGFNLLVRIFTGPRHHAPRLRAPKGGRLRI